MRLFDFKCGDCEKIYEKLVRSEDDLIECKYCGATEDQKKVISVPGLVYAKSNDQPKNHQDLANYIGSGKYFPGYKPSYAR